MKTTYAMAIGERHVGTFESHNICNAFLAFEIAWNARHRNGEPVPREVVEFFAGNGKLEVFSVKDNASTVRDCEGWKQAVYNDTFMEAL